MSSNPDQQPAEPPEANWTIRARTLDEATMIWRLKNAGVQPHEVDRQAGLIVISETGVRKLAAAAPDQAHAASFIEHLDRFLQQTKRG